MIQFPNTERVLNNYGELFRQTYRDNMAAEPYDPSEPLMSNIQFDVESSDGTFEIVFHVADYFRYAENGRGPGKMPPPGSLMKWMEFHHIAPQPMTLKTGRTVLPTMESLEFLIRRKIGQYGTNGDHLWQRTEEELQDRLIRDVKEALEKDFTEYMEKCVKHAK